MWKKILSESITRPEEVSVLYGLDMKTTEKIVSRYPMRINPYYLGLIKEKDDPIYRQCIPDPREISDQRGHVDPLNEEALSPVRGLTHRYPDRVLLLVSSICPTYCRFCNRKRKVGNLSMVSEDSIKQGIDYIRDHRQVRDVLLSGGDPLLLEDDEIQWILERIRSIEHVEIIRIGTRVPCTLPQRITEDLTRIMKKFHPLYIHTHFNHPMEVTSQSALACRRLADAGLPLGCHTVLLKGVNDEPATMKSLMQKLLSIRVRPYYLFQADLARGTSHFWTNMKKGLDIIKEIQGHTSGLCMPHFAVDLPGGGGKVPFLPSYIVGKEKNLLIIENYRGERFRYPVYEG